MQPMNELNAESLERLIGESVGMADLSDPRMRDSAADTVYPTILTSYTLNC